MLHKTVGFSLGTKLADKRAAELVDVANSVVSGDFHLFTYSLSSNSKIIIAAYVDGNRVIKALALQDEYRTDVESEVLKKLYLRMVTDWSGGTPLFTADKQRRSRVNTPDFDRITYTLVHSPVSLYGASYRYERRSIWYEPRPESCSLSPRYRPNDEIDRETVWIAVSG